VGAEIGHGQGLSAIRGRITGNSEVKWTCPADAYRVVFTFRAPRSWLARNSLVRKPARIRKKNRCRPNQANWMRYHSPRPLYQTQLEPTRNVGFTNSFINH
jgi:hypothetical protein